MHEQNSPFSVKGETVLVTAATRGIGRACAVALAKAGANVAIGCRDLKAGETLAKELRQYGAGVLAVDMDMTIPAAISGAFAKVEEELGQLSVLVNNAGHSRPSPAIEVVSEDYQSMFDLNVKAAFFASQAAAKLMISRGRGSIVNIASQAGLIALPGESVYCMTKAAMIHMTRCLAVEWAPHQVRVNAVAPTFIRTDSSQHWLEDKEFVKSLLSRIPLGHVGEPEQVANPVVFLASQASSMMTGTTLAIDGGWTAV